MDMWNNRSGGIASWPLLIPFAILAASAGVLGMAYTAQHLFGAEPCILCLYQRLPYAATGVLAMLAFAFSARPRAQAAVVGLCGLIFLAGAMLAVYHFGVERHWWASVAACGGQAPSGMTLDELRAQLAAPSRKPCDEVNFTVLGLSLAGYNVIVSAFLAAASLAAARLLLGKAAAHKTGDSK